MKNRWTVLSTCCAERGYSAGLPRCPIIFFMFT